MCDSGRPKVKVYIIMKINRFMIAAVSSGSGKTLITCGLLRLLQEQGMTPVSFKCGPDFIDPMFHTTVLGTKSRNLDPWFTDGGRTRMLMATRAEQADIAVLEGVMGFYDGISPDSSVGGSADLAEVTRTPVLLVVPAHGMSRSVLPLIHGFLSFPGGQMIRGIILNRVSASFFPTLKKMIETETGIPVVGYVPKLDASMTLESRHLGLVMPDEIPGLQEKLGQLAGLFQRTMDLKQILAIADSAPDIPDEEIQREEDRVRMEMMPDVRGRKSDHNPKAGASNPDAGASAEGYERKNGVYVADKSHAKAGQYDIPAGRLRIGLARDEAFCFMYEDNLELLRQFGAELVPFSPMRDEKLPENLDGLLLHGGYPELHAEALSKNESMRRAIRDAITGGMPVQAECGGFLYLHRTLTDQKGQTYPLVGMFPEKAYDTGHLTRFGYVELREGRFFGRDVGPVRAHEFHYYESDNPGSAMLAVKPSGKRSWRCVRETDAMYAGFPHLYYYANPGVAAAFLDRCWQYSQRRML